MRNDDPFAMPDPGFEHWDGPQNDSQFSQPDEIPNSLKNWLRSNECADELRQQPEYLKPTRTVVQFVDTPTGLQLHITRGDITKIYTGPESELRKIARAVS